MTCFAPLKANRNPGTGKITFPGDSTVYRIGDMKIPCGRCNGCRIAKSREWAVRCIHEARTHGNNNSFITLTYNRNHLPKDASLNHVDFQTFIRSLRKRCNGCKKKSDPGYQEIRYYMCGEYGRATEANGFIARPHYHAILFGIDFREDRTPHQMRGDNQTYRSGLLEKAWTKGYSEIGNVTFKSAAYVARYIIKKQKKEDHPIFDSKTGEITGHKKQEYTAMSLKPGIGKKFFEENIGDIFPCDYVMLEAGKKLQVPKYYKESLKKQYPEMAEQLRLARVKKAKSSPDNTPERLETRQRIQAKKIKSLKRELV